MWHLCALQGVFMGMQREQLQAFFGMPMGAERHNLTYLRRLRAGPAPSHHANILGTFPRRMQGAPNPAGIMSSKASGEPALMASTSVLSALQQAVAAAAAELQQLRPAGGACEGGGSGSSMVLMAPATPPRIKRTLGDFSVAAILRAAMAQEAGAA